MRNRVLRVLFDGNTDWKSVQFFLKSGTVFPSNDRIFNRDIITLYDDCITIIDNMNVLTLDTDIIAGLKLYNHSVEELIELSNPKDESN